MIVVYSGIYDSDFYFIDLAFGLEFFKVGFWEIFLDSPSEIKLFSAEVYLLFSLSLKGEGWGEGYTKYFWLNYFYSEEAFWDISIFYVFEHFLTKE